MINSWTATLSVNAGLALCTEGLRLWVDAVHDEKLPDFSTLTPQQQRRLFLHPNFQDPDLICFTHCHPDHFSPGLCNLAMERYPAARVVLPEPYVDGQLPLHGQEVMLPAGGRLLTFRRLIHEGEQYRNTPHYGLMIEDEGDALLVLGDCALPPCDSGLQAWVAGREIDTAFVTFPWVTLPQGRRFLMEILRPEHLMVYHLPIPEDDVYGYARAAGKAAATLPGIGDIRLFTRSFQTEILS